MVSDEDIKKLAQQNEPTYKAHPWAATAGDIINPVSAATMVAPEVLGPLAAAERLRQRNGLAAAEYAAEYDVIELNEAFAAQVLACTRGWGLHDDAARVNARGGGIAMGHPLGMTGARVAGTAARRLAESGGRTALVTLCVGVGQGVALALHSV
jgi:acetyl-CoA acetyltransferase